MKWRHWAILIVLLLLNYIIFSTAFTQLAEQRRPLSRPTRTLAPTFETTAPKPVAWIVLPTSTPRPTRTPVTPTSTESALATPEMTPTAQDIAAITFSPTENPPTATAQPTATATPTPRPPTATPTVEPVVHTIKDGETLSKIAQNYGVTVEAIMEANGLTNPDRIVAGQTLIIPAAGGSPPAATSAPQPTNTPKAKSPTSTPVQKPPTVTPAPATGRLQFTATLEWNPMVAPTVPVPPSPRRASFGTPAETRSTVCGYRSIATAMCGNLTPPARQVNMNPATMILPWDKPSPRIGPARPACSTSTADRWPRQR